MSQKGGKLHAVCERRINHFVTSGQVSDYIGAQELPSSMSDV